MTEGVFSVSLAVHVDNVLVATKTREAYITTYTLRPEFSGSPRFALPPVEVEFNNQTPPVGPFPITYLWTFGDGTSTTGTSQPICSFAIYGSIVYVLGVDAIRTTRL